MSTTPRIAARTLRDALALQPDVFEAFWDLYGTLWMDGRVDHATKEVARLRNARVTDCGYCKRVRFSVARQQGLAEDHAALVDDGYATSALSERHKAAIRLADRFLAIPGRPPGATAPGCGESVLSPEEEVELGVALAMFMGFAKMLITLGLEPDDMPVTVVATPGSDRPASPHRVPAP
ncbi:MAG TPA: carboxymuconolactone decarboxylase family protein [Acidimicrobiales bacterium]|nr:carboxymuconolactone decarboxylase family protein [Acidimicrobiales bacterium]